VLYGVSANKRLWWSNAHAPHVAYKPKDNAEPAAAKFFAKGDRRDPKDPAVKYQGGPFVSDGYMKAPKSKVKVKAKSKVKAKR
jgi:uronate dehydrogenase